MGGAGLDEPSDSSGTDAFRAIYFDGLTNKKHQVTVKVSSALEIAEEGNFLAAWAYGDIRRADGPEGDLRLRNIAASKLARLEILNPASQAEVLRHCPMLDGEGTTDGIATGRIVVWSLAAAVSLLVVIWFGVPFIATRLGLVPLSLEKRLGEAVDRGVHAMFTGKNCVSPNGTAALAKLVGALQAEAHLPLEPEPFVLASAVPNAFALPGGKVYVLSGLLEKTETPDELAGVLAHEFGHVAHRDGLRRLIQDSGTGFLIGLLFGDVTGASVMVGVGRYALSAAYSRKAEANADQFASALLQKLGRSPKPLGDLLMRITGPEKDDPFSIFASHPMTADRLTMLEKAPSPTAGVPLLSLGEWEALKAICE